MSDIEKKVTNKALSNLIPGAKKKEEPKRTGWDTKWDSRPASRPYSRGAGSYRDFDDDDTFFTHPPRQPYNKQSYDRPVHQPSMPLSGANRRQNLGRTDLVDIMGGHAVIRDDAVKTLADLCAKGVMDVLDGSSICMKTADLGSLSEIMRDALIGLLDNAFYVSGGGLIPMKVITEDDQEVTEQTTEAEPEAEAKPEDEPEDSEYANSFRLFYRGELQGVYPTLNDLVISPEYTDLLMSKAEDLWEKLMIASPRERDPK